MPHNHPASQTRTPCRRALGIASLLLGATLPAWAMAATPCEIQSGAQRASVIELFTSEGCSSCPPADQWLSTLKGTPVVAQAFHVGYWDYIGWVDRFATPANTARQRELASTNRLNGIYTPQLVRNGRDWPDWRGAHSPQSVAGSIAPARVSISLQRVAQTDQYTAQVKALEGVSQWSAYWTVTEHGHTSRVKAGENRGEFLQHDFVVRQYTPVGRYQGNQTVNFVAIPGHAEHPRQVNLVVHDPRTGEPLQAVSLQCGS